ncbi:MAG: MFS transporter [Propionibacteriaceae bacterium]|nr:MFS transporter [Propionibacteriaceae bacterium]
MNHRLTLPAFLVANAASLFGNAAIAVVLPWLVLERTGDPALAGLVAAASALPGAFAAFVGGWLIDRVGRRRMAVLSDLGSAFSVAALAVVDHFFGLNLVWFIVLGVLGALFDVPGMTARNTLLQNVSSTSGVSLERISSLQGAVFGISFLIGPAVAGWLLAFLPSIQVVWITAACSFVAAVAIQVMPLLPQPTSPDQDSSLLAGFRFVRSSRPLTVLLVVEAGAGILVAPMLAIVLPAHFERIDAPGLLGTCLSLYALGTVIGSLVFGWGFAKRHWWAWATCQVAYVVFALLFAPLGVFWIMAVAMLVAGIGSGLLHPVANVLMTTSVPDALRGRVFSVFSMLSNVAAPAGLGLLTVVVGTAGLGASAWVLAIGWVGLSIYALLAPGMRDHLSTPSQNTDEATLT